MTNTLKKGSPTPWPQGMQIGMTIAAALYGIFFSLAQSPWGFWVGGFMAGILLFNRRYTPIVTGFMICFIAVVIMAFIFKSPWICIMWAFGFAIAKALPNG